MCRPEGDTLEGVDFQQEEEEERKEVCELGETH